jgi:two-component system cell cycle sensor histidine kinase/response regulator CckA
VSDTGAGMTASTQARLFEPFFTTKSPGKGTGLGLATVFGIVTQNKGTIWVYSELGKGSVFKIYLPKANEMCEMVAPTEEHVSLNGTESILVVDDQDDLRIPTCELLRKMGYKISDANNGLQALELIQNSTSPFDLIVTDVVMPEMGGKDLSERLKKLKIKSKILFLSGYTEDTLADYGVSGENPHFLEKPFTTQTLLKKIRTVLQE